MKFCRLLIAALPTICFVGAEQVIFHLNNESNESKYLAESYNELTRLLEDMDNDFRDKYSKIIEDSYEEILKLDNVKEKVTLLKQFQAVKNENEGNDKKIAGIKFNEERLFDYDDEISSEKYDGHKLRIKKTNPESLGIDKVEQHVGYLDVKDTDKHFFFWFFESRNDPISDPVILWLNGGPGCASEGGLFFELGPAFINSTLQPVYNPYSWNSNASVIFLDQPVGAGYSYSSSYEVDTSEKAAKDVYVFLELFFQKFPQFLQNEFHVAGESYAGHYIPAIGTELIDHPERSFNLTSILIGNGLVDAPIQELESPKMLCGEAGLDSLYTEEQCKVLKDNIVQTVAFKTLCAIFLDPIPCAISEHYVNLTYGPLKDLNLNPYDLRMACEDDFLCYNGINDVSDFLNLTSVREAIGVSVDYNYQFCNDDLGSVFKTARDRVIPYESKIAKILDHGVPILLYAGDKDFVCHWAGYNAVSNNIDFQGYSEYRESKFRIWSPNGKDSGQVRGANGLTFLRVYESGHMVPHDQSEVALAMLDTWLSGDYYFDN